MTEGVEGIHMLRPEFDMGSTAMIQIKEINPMGDDADFLFRTKEEAIRFLNTVALDMQDRYTSDDDEAPRLPEGRPLTVDELKEHIEYGLRGYDTRYEVLLCWFHYPA